MAARFPTKTFVRNWLKALLLSPGLLFPAAYLLLYLATNLYLNTTFKKSLTQSVTASSGESWQMNVAAVNSTLLLDSLTLNTVELSRTEKSEKSRRTIPTISIPCPNVEQLLFCQTKQLSSREAIVKKIIAESHLAQ